MAKQQRPHSDDWWRDWDAWWEARGTVDTMRGPRVELGMRGFYERAKREWRDPAFWEQLEKELLLLTLAGGGRR